MNSTNEEKINTLKQKKLALGEQHKKIGDKITFEQLNLFLQQLKTEIYKSYTNKRFIKYYLNEPNKMCVSRYYNVFKKLIMSFNEDTIKNIVTTTIIPRLEHIFNKKMPSVSKRFVELKKEVYANIFNLCKHKWIENEHVLKAALINHLVTIMAHYYKNIDIEDESESDEDYEEESESDDEYEEESEEEYENIRKKIWWYEEETDEHRFNREMHKNMIKELNNYFTKLIKFMILDFMVENFNIEIIVKHLEESDDYLKNIHV